MRYVTILQEIGFTDHEAKVYLAALEFVSATVTELARKTGLPRTSVQSAVHTLYQRGLLITYIKKRQKHWSAENPEKIMRQLEIQRQDVRSVLPELQRLHLSMTARPSVNTYIGGKEARVVFDDLIVSKYPIDMCGDYDAWEKSFGVEGIKDLKTHRIRNKLPLRLLTNRTARTEAMHRLDAQDNRAVRFAARTITSASFMVLFGEKVVLFSLGPFPMATVIHDRGIYQLVEAMFTTLWEQSA